MHRGIERRTIFEYERDHRRFLELLGEVCERFRVRIHAYCLLGNNYHLIVQTPDANLSRAMQWLGISYSSWLPIRICFPELPDNTSAAPREVPDF